MENISQTIFNELEKGLYENAKSTFIVSGGSSPVQIFRELSAMQTRWSNVTISLVDDRVVNVNHDDSNEKLVNETLITDKAKDANYISICNQPNDLLNLKRPFHVMLLGMGEDGHFASLFPQLIETNPEYFNLDSAPDIFFTAPMGNPCHKRVSMNLSMILKSKNIFLLVSSEKKLEVLNHAKSDKSLPLYYLLNQNKVDIKIIKDF